MNREEKFFEALREIFVGARVEGESGFVNLMRIKSQYYTNGVFPRLTEDIERSLEDLRRDFGLSAEEVEHFREELFDRLYTFFRRYFSESGSLYFRFTPPHEHVYEKVYTDDRDVVLFWKTHMLYYVKTDRLFRNMEMEVDGFRFFFDVSRLEHKRANEKRDLVYTFRERRDDGALVFTVAYAEGGRRTNIKTGERVMEVDPEKNEIRVDLSKLYPDIDLAETLSCLTEKPLRCIEPDPDKPTRLGLAVFEGGTVVDLRNPPWEMVKLLIWW